MSNYLETNVQSSFDTTNFEEISMMSAERAKKVFSSSKYQEGCQSPSQYSEASHQSTEYTENAEDNSDCNQSLSNNLLIQRSISRSTTGTFTNEQSEFDELAPQISFAEESIEKEEKIDIENNEEIKNWCERKDKILKNLASKCKYDWKKIAKKFNAGEQTSLTPLALKQKYKELSRVSIPLRVKFTHQEDLLIAKYFETYGCDWTAIASHFADRTAMMLKNRYYSFIRKRNLLQDMLEEVKETNEEAESVSAVPTQATEELQSEPFQFFAKNEEGPKVRRFSMTSFNPIVFEIENSLSCQLYDRITDLI